MGSRPPARRLLLGVLLATLFAPGIVWAFQEQKQVLVLYSTRRDTQIAIVGERELPRILEQGLREGLDLYSEFIDPARFPDPRYSAAMRDFFRLKYKGHHFDLIVAMGDDALAFMGGYRDELWPGTPIVYYAIFPGGPPPPDATGIVAELTLGGSVALATRLQPDARHVFVVTGATAGDREYEALARTQLAAFTPRLDVTFLSGLPTRELERRLASLPQHSFVYYVLVDRDGAGEYFHPLQYLDRVSAAANAPTYCWVDSAMGHGIVGGSLKSIGAQVEAVGALALRVLSGERAGDIPPAVPDLNVTQVDWRQMQRWGISESRLPAGAIVLFREPSAWTRYKGYIIAAVVILLTQTALILALLVQRERRRGAERQARDLGGRLIHAQEDERARIARELHDDISQQLALLQVDLKMLRLEGPAAETTAEILGRTESVARSVHDLSHRLHPARLRLIGLVPALSGLQREVSHSGMEIVFTHEDVPASIPPELTLCLYRIVQEALQNAAKYSRAQKVSVRLRRNAGQLVLVVEDNGVGFDVAKAWAKGLGLISMRERLEPLDGTFEIRSAPGAGTRVEVRVPFPADAPAQA